MNYMLDARDLKKLQNWMGSIEAIGLHSRDDWINIGEDREYRFPILHGKEWLGDIVLTAGEAKWCPR